MGLVQGLPGLVLTRIGVGVFEAPCFPANSRILATWFPQHERARANSIYSVGQYAGIAFLSVPLFWVTQQFGWRSLFFLAGGLGVAARRADVVALPRAEREPDGERGGTGAHRGRRRRRVHRAHRSRSAGATSAGCCATARCSARRSASSAATPPRCSSSPGSRPIWSPPAAWTSSTPADDDAAVHRARRSACWSPGSCPIGC